MASGLHGDDLPKAGAEVSGSAWALNPGDLGCDEGPSYDEQHKPDGQIDVPFTVEARQDIPYEHDFHKLEDIDFAGGRVAIDDPNPDSGVPAPFSGFAGAPLPFDEVGPVRELEPYPLAGRSAPAAGSGTGALFREPNSDILD
jgi:hypothetical protein